MKHTWERNKYNILVGKLEGKIPLGRARRRWSVNSRKYLSEIGWEEVDWIHLALDRDKKRTHVNM
jgi:hypothetical protein